MPDPPTLGPDSLAMVVTTDLVVRSEPAISDTSTLYPDSLDAPMLLYVVDGPVAANGYDWYLVKPFHADYLPHGDELVIDPLIGWVAASGRDGEPWIEAARIDCPAPDLDGVRHLSPTGRLACFGDQELELAGELGGCFVGILGRPHRRGYSMTDAPSSRQDIGRASYQIRAACQCGTPASTCRT